MYRYTNSISISNFNIIHEVNWEVLLMMVNKAEVQDLRKS